MKKLNVLALSTLVALSGLTVAIAQPGAGKGEEKPAAQPAAQPKPADAPKPAAQPAEVKPGEAKPADAKPAEASKGVGSPIFDIADGKTPAKAVKTSEIKLLIEDLKEGDGKECPVGGTVTIHYNGALMDGKVFDSTREKDAVTFPLRSLIQGWQMGIPGMKVNGVRRLTIPYQLAYGEREIPGPDGKPLIPSKSNLVFLIELKDVK